MTTYEDLPEQIKYVYSSGDWARFSDKERAYLEGDLSPVDDSRYVKQSFGELQQALARAQMAAMPTDQALSRYQRDSLANCAFQDDVVKDYWDKMYEGLPTDFSPLFDPEQKKRMSLADRVRGFLNQYVSAGGAIRW